MIVLCCTYSWMFLNPHSEMCQKTVISDINDSLMIVLWKCKWHLYDIFLKFDAFMTDLWILSDIFMTNLSENYHITVINLSFSHICHKYVWWNSEICHKCVKFLKICHISVICIFIKLSLNCHLYVKWQFSDTFLNAQAGLAYQVPWRKFIHDRLRG